MKKIKHQNLKNDSETDEDEKEGLIPIRYVVAFLGFLGFTFNYMLRVNFNFTIVSMVNFKNSNNTDNNSSSEDCGFVDDSQTNSNETTKNDFDWDSVAQSQVIGAFFYGYVVSQVPGGRLSEMFGAKLIFTIAMGAIAILNLLIPIASKALEPDAFPWVVVLVRALMGIFGGPSFPCMSAMLAQWAPVHERSRMAAFIYAGSQAGTIIAFPLSGLIADNLGWEYVFYIQGGACFFWLAAWLGIKQENISRSVEVHFHVNAILGNTGFYLNDRYFGDYKQVANWGNNWVFHLLLTELPIYMKTILGQNLSSNSLYSALPYACMWAFSIVVSFTADIVGKKGLLGTGAIRKVANTIAHGGPGLCLLGICFTGCNRELTIALFTLGVTLQGALYTGFFVNPLDIAPNYAGTILGITNGFGTVPGWLAPLMAASFTEDEPNMANWKKVWYVTAALMLVETTFYLVFGSGEEQPWNKAYENKENIESHNSEIKNNRDNKSNTISEK